MHGTTSYISIHDGKRGLITFVLKEKVKSKKNSSRKNLLSQTRRRPLLSHFTLSHSSRSATHLSHPELELPSPFDCSISPCCRATGDLSVLDSNDSNRRIRHLLEGPNSEVEMRLVPTAPPLVAVLISRLKAGAGVCDGDNEAASLTVACCLPVDQSAVAISEVPWVTLDLITGTTLASMLAVKVFVAIIPTVR